MKYVDGLLIGAGTILAAIYSEVSGETLPMCLVAGVCAGFAADFTVRRVLKWRRNRRT